MTLGALGRLPPVWSSKAWFESYFKLTYKVCKVEKITSVWTSVFSIKIEKLERTFYRRFCKDSKILCVHTQYIQSMCV